LGERPALALGYSAALNVVEAEAETSESLTAHLDLYHAEKLSVSELLQLLLKE
jgi:hypothetical protein